MLHTILDSLDLFCTVMMVCISVNIIALTRTYHTPTFRGLRLTVSLMGLTALALFAFDVAHSLGLDPLVNNVWRKHVGRPLLFLSWWAFWRWLFGERQNTAS